MLPKLEQTKVEFPEQLPNFLYQIIVDPRVMPEEEVYVFGITTMISAAGDLVIQNAVGQRVFGVAAGMWFGLFIVNQDNLKPVPEFFPDVSYD